MGAKRFTVDPVERWGKIGHGTLRVPKGKIVETDIDERTNLDVGQAMGAPELGTFLIIV